MYLLVDFEDNASMNKSLRIPYFPGEDILCVFLNKAISFSQTLDGFVAQWFDYLTN